MDKTRAAVKDLYSRILVAIRSAESISSRIEKLRDEELQPQIIELLQGLVVNSYTLLGLNECFRSTTLLLLFYLCAV